MKKMNECLIIGNGITRKDLNINSFNMKKYGCNALYREFDPDVLVAFDEKIVSEIKGSNFNLKKLYIPPEKDRYEPVEFNYNQPRNNAGMVAMDLAIKNGFNKLICIGVDFVLEDNALNVLNVFDNTNAYEAETRESYTDTLNRCKYLEWTVMKNKNVEYVFLFPEKYSTIKTRLKLENVKYEYRRASTS